MIFFLYFCYYLFNAGSQLSHRFHLFIFLFFPICLSFTYVVFHLCVVSGRIARPCRSWLSLEKAIQISCGKIHIWNNHVYKIPKQTNKQTKLKIDEEDVTKIKQRLSVSNKGEELIQAKLKLLLVWQIWNPSVVSRKLENHRIRWFWAKLFGRRYIIYWFKKKISAVSHDWNFT